MLIVFSARSDEPVGHRLDAAALLVDAAGVTGAGLRIVCESGDIERQTRRVFPDARILTFSRTDLTSRAGVALVDEREPSSEAVEKLAEPLRALAGDAPDLCIDATAVGLCALLYPSVPVLTARGRPAIESDSANAQINALERRLGGRIEEVEAEIEHLRLRAADDRALQIRIADLSRDALDSERAAQKLRFTLQEMRASTSWKVTAPVRAAIDGFAQWKRKFPEILRRAIGSREAAPVPEAARPVLIAPSAHERIDEPAESPPDRPRARVIAFYLPQFHPIPENDQWWGEGFTEWTNVTRAAPQFEGHYQPHLPHDIGFYDLREPAVMARQIEMAKAHGIYGFCFYFYWFGGKRLLEAPLRNWLSDPTLDLPFCLCWANENWTRRWDGKDNDVLIAQEHSTDDDLAFIDHVSAYMRDPRYMRVDGKPLLVVYRPSLLPDAAATVARWRVRCRLNGVGELHIACVQSFEVVDPKQFGMDAAIEFPPNNTEPPILTDHVRLINPDYAGTVYDYRWFVTEWRKPRMRDYTLYRGAFPSWDNEARRKGRGTVFVNGSPDLFRDALTHIIDDVEAQRVPEDRRLVFVNAWNEWAEGAHLEPDQRYGYAWLHAVRDAVSPPSARRLPAASAGADDDIETDGCRRLVLVVHDAYRHGAQYLALALAQRLSRWITIEIVLLGEGPLTDDFKAIGAVHDLAGIDPEGEQARALARRLKARGAVGAICNSTVSGLFLKTLAAAGLKTVALVHELPRIIAEYRLARHVEAIAGSADAVVFPGPLVRDAFPERPKGAIILKPQGLYTHNKSARGDAQRAARSRLRRRLGLARDAEIVMCVAYGDRRKGLDLFIDLAAALARARPQARCVWVGEIEATWKDEQMRRGAAHGVIFVGFQDDTSDYFAGADVFALTSREDPFPTVVLMALECGVPVVGFQGVGDFTEVLQDGAGALAPVEDVDAFAGHVLRLLSDPAARAAAGAKGRALLDGALAFQGYAIDIARLAGAPWPSVSAVVPNYDYARFLPKRLDSILGQTVPVRELIVLDDCSTDDSLRVLDAYAADAPAEIRIVTNARNSGSPFAQWRRAALEATSELLWIAEADDLSSPDFLAAASAPFLEPSIVLSHTQSEQMGPKGETLQSDYLDYVADVDPDRWRRAFTEAGEDEIQRYLSVKNTIPNVSACVFRKEVLAEVLNEHGDAIAALRNTGDWLAYLRVLERGRIAYDPRPLNRHRRHEGGVTLSRFGVKLVDEIRQVQRFVRETYALDPTIVRKQELYVRSLETQFAEASARLEISANAKNT
jgi:glycosyltransferase involved in cell wall biosynthesis